MNSPLLPPSRPSPIQSYAGRSVSRSFTCRYNPSCVPNTSGSTFWISSFITGRRSPHEFGCRSLAKRRLNVMTHSASVFASSCAANASALDHITTTARAILTKLMVPSLLLVPQHRVHRNRLHFLLPPEEHQLDQHRHPHDLPAEVLYDVAAGLHRPARRQHVVADQDALPRADRVLVHLQDAL